MRVLLVLVLASCSHPQQAQNCAAWKDLSEHLEKNGTLALNVDPMKARQWLEDEARKDGCKL